MNSKVKSTSHRDEIGIQIGDVSPNSTSQTIDFAGVLKPQNVPLSKSVKFTEFMVGLFISKHNKLIISFINLYCIGEVIFSSYYIWFQNTLKTDWYLVFLPIIVVICSIYTGHIVKTFEKAQQLNNHNTTAKNKNKDKSAKTSKIQAPWLYVRTKFDTTELIECYHNSDQYILNITWVVAVVGYFCFALYSVYILVVSPRNTLEFFRFIYWFGFCTISFYTASWMLVVTCYELYILLLNIRHLVVVLDAKNDNNNNDEFGGNIIIRSKFVRFNQIYEKYDRLHFKVLKLLSFGISLYLIAAAILIWWNISNLFLFNHDSLLEGLFKLMNASAFIAFLLPIFILQCEITRINNSMIKTFNRIYFENFDCNISNTTNQFKDVQYANNSMLFKTSLLLKEKPLNGSVLFKIAKFPKAEYVVSYGRVFRAIFYLIAVRVLLNYIADTLS